MFSSTVVSTTVCGRFSVCGTVFWGMLVSWILPEACSCEGAVDEKPLLNVKRKGFEEVSWEESLSFQRMLWGSRDLKCKNENYEDEAFI